MSVEQVSNLKTTPLFMSRKYQAANILLNMYVVQSPFLLNYAWCIGVQSVTTDNCWEFSHIQDCHLYQVRSENQSAPFPQKFSLPTVVGPGSVLMVSMFARRAACFSLTYRHAESSETLWTTS